MTALVVLSGQPAAAGALSFSLKDGRVTILAYSVTVREILSEWGRFGGVSIVGDEALSGLPVTVELQDVPEAKALDVLLRTVSGYVAVSRSQPLGRGSIFQSIRILSTSRAPALPPPTTAQAPAPRMPVSAAFIPPMVAPQSLTPLDQAGLRQNHQALQDLLAREKARNGIPAPTTLSAPAVSTDASRPGLITPYTPPSNQRPAPPEVPRK
jgi:hypothetical protein